MYFLMLGGIGYEWLPFSIIPTTSHEKICIFLVNSQCFLSSNYFHHGTPLKRLYNLYNCIQPSAIICGLYHMIRYHHHLWIISYYIILLHFVHQNIPTTSADESCSPWTLQWPTNPSSRMWTALWRPPWRVSPISRTWKLVGFLRIGAWDVTGDVHAG